MKNNYTLLHLHTMLSNPTTVMDSVTGYKDYVLRAKECGMDVICFTEHGNFYEWVHKKEFAEANGLKYIHGCEFYVTKEIGEGIERVRDNYHTVLIAKNYDGVKELNKLSTKSFTDEQRYYSPRITYEQLKNTSDNVIITTACLGSILGKNDDEELVNDFINFLSQNNHRCFLEIQHHNVEDQKEYNKRLLDISKKNNIRLVAGTDTHALNEVHVDARIVLQRAKETYFDNEEGWDLAFKTYDELLKSYAQQGCLSKDIYIEAINNTNVIADMVEEFTLGRSNKYPRFYDNPRQVLEQKLVEQIKLKNIEMTQERKDRIKHELDVYEKCDAIDYILLDAQIDNWARDNDIFMGYSRGSVSGSYIAYLMNITDVDSLKFGMIFERFMNPERVSLCDVDKDLSSTDRIKVKDYLYSLNGVYCADIATFNTIAEKGAIRDVGRALRIPLPKIDEISKNIDNENLKAKYKKEYPELFKYVDILNGVIVSVGVHPAGVIVSPLSLEDNLGLFNTSTNDYPIVQLNMSEVDSLNYVKLDLLGLDNVAVINETCKLAGIKRLTPDNMDFEDDAVWDSLGKSSISIFQWESVSAEMYLKRLLSKEVLDKIWAIDNTISRIDLVSVANGAIRPSGDSYREKFFSGEFNDTGHPALNEYLKSSLNFLVFQEQIMGFLNKFCGFTLAEADLVRRGFAKKTGTEQYIPQIKEGFIKTMMSEYGESKERAEEIIVGFLQVISDASSYGFSLNHSLPYTHMGYACAYLRHYYPLEYITTVLNVFASDQGKSAKMIEYMENYTDITLSPIKFRHSKDVYTFDKDTRTIHKGIESIKYMNKKVSLELYDLRNNHYRNFLEVLEDIKTNTSCNSKQLDILIKLDFFAEFGKSQYLLDIVELHKWVDKKQISKAKVGDTPFPEHLVNKYSGKVTDKTYMNIDFPKLIAEAISDIKNKSIPIKELIQTQKDFLGYVSVQIDGIEKRVCYVSKIDIKHSPKVELYLLANGKTETFKINKKYFTQFPFKEGDIIKVLQAVKKPKFIPITDEKGKVTFEKSKTEMEWWIENYTKGMLE